MRDEGLSSLRRMHRAAAAESIGKIGDSSGIDRRARRAGVAQRRGISLRAGSPSPSSGASSAPQLIVGTPDRVAKDRTVGPALSRGAAVGVFVAIDNGRLYALRADDTRGQELSAAALAVSDPDHPGRLCLVLIAQNAPALQRLLDGFTPAAANAHVALGLTAAGIIALPVGSANVPLALASGGEK